MRIWLAAIALAALITMTAPGSAFAETHVVNVANFAFTPDELTIQTGDTVRWEWESGVHTVTSGTGPADSEEGFLFDMDMHSTSIVFEFVFNDAGDFPYFCLPHFAGGMTGMIRVEEGVAVDVITWGKIKRVFQGAAPLPQPIP